MNPDLDSKALIRERKFGGGSRWVCTFAAIVSIPLALWFIPENSSFAIFIGILGLIQAVLAVINWRNWLRKSEAERAPLRFLSRLEIRDASIPFKRDEFNHIRQAAILNAFIAGMALIYTACGIGAVFASQVPLGIRIVATAIGVGAACIFWRCGKRFLRAAKILSCPGCKDLLTTQGDSVLKTGCCRKCSKTVLSD